MTDVREKLFESALAIFGRPRSCFSESVQNPNCVTSEEDLEEIYRQAEKFIDDKEEQVRLLRHTVLLWMTQLREAFRKGELKEW